MKEFAKNYDDAPFRYAGGWAVRTAMVSLTTLGQSCLQEAVRKLHGEQTGEV